MYEVELRAKLETEEYDRIKAILDEKESPNNSTFTSYLFEEPQSLRIRVFEKSDQVLVTQKGQIEDGVARKEVEFYLNKPEVSGFLDFIAAMKYSSAAVVKTERFSYQYDDMIITLNRIPPVGDFMEVEILVDNREAIGESELRLSHVIEKFGVTKLSSEEYKKYFEQMRQSEVKTIDEIKKLFV
jgi:predicted adenylyl cyclase CyaB